MLTKEKLTAIWVANKKLIVVLLAGTVAVGGVAGAGYGVHKSKEDKSNVAFTQQVDVDASANGEAQAPPLAEEEIVTFEDTDKDGNVLTITPIFNDDGYQIIAGYILEAKDKDGNKLTAEQYPLLNSVVSATRVDNTGKLVFDADNNLVPMEAMSNKKGDLIVIKDVMDLDGDQDVEEYFKLVYSNDANGIKKVSIEYTNVEVKTDKDNKKVVVADNKEIEAEIVDKENQAVAKREEKEAKKNASIVEKVEKKQKNNTGNSTTTKHNTISTSSPAATTTSSGASTTNPTTTKKSDSTTTTKPEETTNPEETTTKPASNDISIVLKKNSKAECDSSNVEIADKTITIKAAGDYEITSDTDNWHGHIVIEVPSKSKTSIKIKDVNISFNSDNIIRIINTSIETNRPFLDTEIDTTPGAPESTFDQQFADFSDIDTEDVPEVTLSFPEGTHSSFVSTANKVTGTLYNEAKLKIKGKGSVNIESKTNANNCICSTKSITIENCTVSLATANNTSTEKIASSSGAAKGIFAYGRINVESGTLNIKSNGDAIRCSRIFAKGGTMNIESSACDAFDVDSEINISGGTVNATSLQKSCFKVRAVNNNGGEYTSKGGKEFTFKITGGTVVGEGSKSTAVQASSTQPSIRTYIGQYRAAAKNSKKQIFFPGVARDISIMAGDSTVKGSKNKCTTFLYSSSSLSAEDGKYKMFTSVIPEDRGDVVFAGKVGEAFHE